MWVQVVRRSSDEEFCDFVAVILLSGARAQEMFWFEAKHLDGNSLFLPINDSKGKKRLRVVYLPDEAVPIVARLVGQYLDGRLFWNSKGEPWKPHTIRLWVRRLKKPLDMPGLCATTLRHSFAHHRLTSGRMP